MKRIIYSLCILILLAGCSMFKFNGDPANISLDDKTLAMINDAVFEVVVKKPDTDPLTYEKPLPMDLIPYAIRTDKYIPIGTAFAIGPNELASVAHVTYLGTATQYKEVLIRDKDKNVYPIDMVLKYSDHQDFVVFTLKNKTLKHFFQLNPNPRLNDKVFAVGNALGQGIVIRDGLYTSSTPEEEDGAWTWMRFSAAASPGNSGGPLLDRTGKVVGIVMGKSPNENLNYALPISEVIKAKPNTASLHKKLKYTLDNMDMTEIDTLQKEVSLPKSYTDLNKELITTIDAFSDKMLKNLLSKNKEEIFPRGKGSVNLLHNTVSAVFPNVIMKGNDGVWDAFYPKETKSAEIGKNGYISYGGLAGSLLYYVQKPDDVSLETFYKDSKLFMDLLLKGINLPREIGGEKIKITSFGKPAEDHMFKDSYGRKWLVRSWLLNFEDIKVVTFSLPVPGGCITMMRVGQTGLVDNGHIPDLKVLADFTYISYYGTLKKWKEFFTQRDILPDALSTITVKFEYDKKLEFRSKRLAFSYGPDVMGITDKSYMKLMFTYFEEKGAVIWDLSDIVVGEEKSTETSFMLSRYIKPAKEMSDKYQDKWDKILRQKFPYNSSAYYEDKSTFIGAVYTKNRPVDKAPDTITLLYTIGYGKEGKVEQADMETTLKKFMQSLTVFE